VSTSSGTGREDAGGGGVPSGAEGPDAVGPDAADVPAIARVAGGEATDVAALGERAAMLERLSARATVHEQAARSPRTRELYASDWAHFARWCAMAGQTALPAGVDTLRGYLTDLEATTGPDGSRVYRPATLARRLAAIAAVHKDAGVVSATRDPKVRAVLAGISRTRRQARHQMRPLLLADVRAILAGLDYRSWPLGVIATRDAFALLAGFAGALRRSELTALRVADLTWHPEDGLHVRVRTSKTDQEGHGATLALPFGADPRTCPPCAWLRWARLLHAARHGRPEMMRTVFATPPWLDWTHLCGTSTTPAPLTHDAAHTPATDDAPATATAQTLAHTSSGGPAEAAVDAGRGDPVRRVGETLAIVTELDPDIPVLCGVRKGGTLTGAPISGDGLYLMVKRRAAAAGITGPVGFHSLRAGFVTQARRAGADTRAVRRQTRHGSDAMVELYDRDHAPLLGNAVLEIGL
jgi:integrase